MVVWKSGGSGGKFYSPWGCNGDHSGGHHSYDDGDLKTRRTMTEHYLSGGYKTREQALEESGIKNGTIEVTRKVEKVDIAEAARSAKQFGTYMQELGFPVDVWTSGQRKFWRGQWVEQPVWHVSGKKGSSAFHMRWVEGKAVDCKIQVNGGPVQWVKVTEAKKMMLGAQ
jgi:hypothetical protein